MKSLCVLTAVLMLGGFGIGCGGDDEEELPEVDCDTGTIPKYADVTILSKCTTCHDSKKTGAARVEADDDVNFDTEAAALKSAMKAAEEVNEGAMPPASANITVTAAEKDALYKWALCSD